MNACSVNPTGHEWDGLACRWCDVTRTAGEAIVSGLASRRGGDEVTAHVLLDAHRAEALTEVADLFESYGRAMHPDDLMSAHDVAQKVREHATGQAPAPQPGGCPQFTPGRIPGLCAACADHRKYHTAPERHVVTATVTVTAEGDYYVDADDLGRHVDMWIQGGLEDRDDIRGVQVAITPAPQPENAPEPDLADVPALALPQIVVPCPDCGAKPGAPCTSHSGTRIRRHDTHQARRAAWAAGKDDAK